MEQFFILTKRNLDVYLRDKGAVFFSFLSALIVIGLMVFFLGDMNIEATAEYGDQLITLTTCEYSQEDGRFAVVGRKK